jgi:hypothetical protein
MNITTLTVAIMASVCVAGCAFKGRAQPADSPAELRAQDQARALELQECLAIQAPHFDDGVSDAATVGRAVARACYLEGERSLLARARSTGTKEAHLRAGWPRTLTEMAAQTVLAQRAHRPAAPPAAAPAKPPPRPARPIDPA